MNSTANVTGLERDYGTRVFYIVLPLIFILVCVVAVVVNIRILVCIRWIRRPISPTLFISLSLALADAWTAFMQGIVYLYLSFLPIGLGYEMEDNCQWLAAEVFRLSGILVSSLHVLALAGNHYFGILFPFQSRRWMTHTNLSILLSVLWIAPTTHMFVYFSSSEGYGFLSEKCNSTDFMYEYRFRAMFSTLFFIPTIILFLVYIHIYLIVRKHLASRRWFNRHSRRLEVYGDKTERQHQIEGNLKAIWTSILILSTYVICFMPVVLIFIFICMDCYFIYDNVEHWVRLILGSTSNALLIIKPLLNPLIYASRMQEIRTASKKMNAACSRLFCIFSNSDEIDKSNCSGTEIHRFSFLSGSSRKNHIAINQTSLGNGLSKKVKPRDEATDL